MKKIVSSIVALLLCLCVAIPSSAQEAISARNQMDILSMSGTVMIQTTDSSFDISGGGIAHMVADMIAVSSTHPVKSTKVVASLMQDGKTIKTFTATADDGFASLDKLYAVYSDHEYRVKYVFYAYSTDGLSENITVYSQYVYYD
ncbi:MAG: hypothetical protein E7476_09155 [Ruminococcaceae bacterium]|nr:hypothetical protein [Oscillospiraceae bacterium]